MAMLHYLDKNPDKQIKKFFIGSQIGYHQEQESKDVLDMMRSIINKDIHIIDEKQIIEEDISHSEVKGLKNLSSYTSAIGAAQSLAV